MIGKIPSDKADNPDDWDGNDWAEELFENVINPEADENRYPDPGEHHKRFSPDRSEEEYASEWKLISDNKRNYCKFNCEKCGIDLNERTHLLHVHHIDRNKYNNEYYNLIAVCVLCHSEYPGHYHLYLNLKKDDLEFLKKKQNESYKSLKHGTAQSAAP